MATLNTRPSSLAAIPSAPASSPSSDFTRGAIAAVSGGVTVVGETLDGIAVAAGVTVTDADALLAVGVASIGVVAATEVADTGVAVTGVDIAGDAGADVTSEDAGAAALPNVAVAGSVSFRVAVPGGCCSVGGHGGGVEVEAEGLDGRVPLAAGGCWGSGSCLGGVFCCEGLASSAVPYLMPTSLS